MILFGTVSMIVIFHGVGFDILLGDSTIHTLIRSFMEVGDIMGIHIDLI